MKIWNIQLKSIGNKNFSLIVLFYVINIALTAYLFYFLFSLPKMDIEIQTDTGKIVGTFVTLGVLAYTFGLRHAVDADHLAAIDNITRKLLQEGKDPYFVGTFFSLGHSTVVILLSVMLMVATRYVVNSLCDIENVGSMVGTLVSGGFLYIIGFLNLLILLELYNIYKIVRKEKVVDEHKLNEILLKRGFMNKFFGKLFKIVNKQYQAYVIGFLFGLGFDTATEVAILAISATLAGAFVSIPMVTILALPALFTLGMTLVDTADGIFMRLAYGWAFKDALRKMWYNLTMTLISIVIAYGIGTIELLGLLACKFNLSGFFWDQVAALNNVYWENIGYFIIGTFALTWIISGILYKYKIERRAQS